MLLLRFRLVENLNSLSLPELQQHLLEVPPSDRRDDNYLLYNNIHYKTMYNSEEFGLETSSVILTGKIWLPIHESVSG